ncbi:sensor domain-containing diguanylate cyclase [Alkalihalobacterium bogoriense]|uniref:sensor domain-containing diguanylate cyclase n=1 Tax=Alkalihalobacterium bogoriense TaxID=246272 RepID=UPI00047C3669|nr:sensor domain-containing diguanylate cyclase [Alkalihalobacterium bogoriense]
MQSHFFMSFIPFLFLFAMAAEVFLRSPYNSFHRLTSLLLLLFSFIFLADYHIALLSIEDAEVFIVYFKYIPAFLAMILSIYFFKKVSKISLHWLFHFVFLAPLLGIFLMLLFPTEYTVNIHENNNGFRTELSSPALLIIILITGINTLAWNMVLLVLGVKKSKAQHYSFTFQKRLAVIYKGTLLTTIYLLITGLIIYIGVQLGVSLLSLSSYSSIIWAITIRYAMVKFDFLTTASQRFELLFQMSSDGIVFINKRGKIEEANSAFLNMVGREKVDILQQPFSTLLKPEGRKLLSQFLNNAFFQNLPFQVPFTINNKDGLDIIVQASSSYIDFDGESYIYLVLRDITSQTLYENQLKKQAYEDPLTGLGNRALFHKQINTYLQDKPQPNQIIAIVLLDLDKFKWINDTYGHAAGDAALKHVSFQLKKNIPDDAIPIRMGGDEFAIILREKNRVMIETTIQTVLSSIKQPFYYQDTAISINGSAGISLAFQDGDDVDSLLNLADKAMYHAKKNVNEMYCFSIDIDMS